MDVVCAAEWLRVVLESICSGVTATREHFLSVFPDGQGEGGSSEQAAAWSTEEADTLHQLVSSTRVDQQHQHNHKLTPAEKKVRNQAFLCHHSWFQCWLGQAGNHTHRQRNERGPVAAGKTRRNSKPSTRAPKQHQHSAPQTAHVPHKKACCDSWFASSRRDATKSTANNATTTPTTRAKHNAHNDDNTMRGV